MWDTAFWKKVRRAVERVAGALVLLVAHWLFDKALAILLAEWPAVKLFASIVATGIFLVVYFVLLFDILTIFVPLHTTEDRPNT